MNKFFIFSFKYFLKTYVLVRFHKIANQVSVKNLIAADFHLKYFPLQDFRNVPRIKFFRKHFCGFCLGNRLTSFWKTLSFFIARNFALIAFGTISDIKRYKTDGLNSVNFILVDALPKLNISEAFT